MTGRDRAAPRPVLCVTAHEHRDRDVADGVLAGPLHAQRARRSTLGTEPDWRGADLPADEEWRIEWVKFGYGTRPRARLRARPASRATGTAWERLVDSWIAQVPPDHDAAEVTARRILNWIYAWQRVRRLAPRPRAGCAAEQHREPRRAHVREQPRPRGATTARSSSTRCSIAALALPELDPDGDCSASSRSRARPQPRDRLPRRTASTSRPRRTTTSSRCARSSACARTRAASACALPAGLRRTGSRAPATSRSTAAGPTARSRRCRTPTPATTRSCSRSRPTCSRDQLLYAAPTGARHAAARARRASPTAATTSSAAAGETGPAFEHERFLIFDCGPLGDGGHGHYDLLSVEVFAARAPAGRRPGPVHLLRGAAEPAPLVQGHRRAQHGLRRRARPDPVPRRRPEGARRRGALPRPHDRGPGSTCSPARRAAPPTRRSTGAGSRSSTARTG